MRRYSAGVAVVIDDEPAIRTLLASILSDHGCAVATSDNAADMRRRIENFAPDILFLDIGLRHNSAFELLDILATSGFSGAIQIVSGKGPETLDRVFRTGLGLGLRMREPLAKPFRAEAIEQILHAEGLIDMRGGASPLEGAVIRRAWIGTASSATALVDLAIGSDGGDRGLAQTPAEQLLWWTSQQHHYRQPLLDLPAPAALCIAARIADIPSIAPALSETEHQASHPSPTVVLSEDDLCGDLELTNTLLCVLRLRGATIRVTGCGPRFFVLMEHAPLPVDQAVLDRSPASFGRIGGMLPRIANLLHRSGTLFLADDVPIPFDPIHLDLWRSTAPGWQPFEPTSRTWQRAWQPVALADALSIRKFGRPA